MIDLHNHIVPGIDDGAADIAESLDIARQFVSEGVTRIAATPHFNAAERWDSEDLRVRERVRNVQEAIDEHNIGLTVVPGNEIYISPDVLELLKAGSALPLGGSKTVLVECPFDQRPLYLDETLFQLQLAGYQPVLAHPERYSFVQRNVEAMETLVERGIVLQMTAPALLGEYGAGIRRTSESLLRRGFYACAASDRHHPGPARSLRALHDLLVSMAGGEVADLLLKVNPGCLLRGESVRRPAPIPSHRRTLFPRLFGRRRGQNEEADSVG